MGLPRVLVVDDEPSVRWTMAEFLCRGGYVALPAADCDGALAVAGAGEVDAAVVDLLLGGRSGLDLLRELSARGAHVPVIVITGEPDSPAATEVARMGAYDFLPKPVMKETLLKAVAGAVERKRLADEKRRLELEAQRRAEELERLAQQEKIAFLGRAAAQVAHEVRNPLAGLLLYTMHLRSTVAGKLTEGELALIDKMVETINHLADTTNQVLDFARPVKLSPRPTDLNRVLTDVLQLLRPQLDAGRVEPRVELDGSCTCVVLDEPSIRSVLMNLALNAVQAMPGGGALTVRTEAREGFVNLFISDEGDGMSQEQVENIFQPFYTTKSRGLGLGMPFAQKVVEQHGGAVSVESRPGAGTTVRVRLPNRRGAGADASG